MSLRRVNPKRDLNEASIVRALRAMGWAVTHMSKKDWPDLFCTRGNSAVWVEVKKPKGKPTAGQNECAERLLKAGYLYHVAHDENDAVWITDRCAFKESDL